MASRPSKIDSGPRPSADSLVMAYLIAREEIQRKVDEITEKKLGRGGKERLLANKSMSDKSKSIKDMIGHSARIISQEIFLMLPSRLEEDEKEEEIREVEELPLGAMLSAEIVSLTLELMLTMPSGESVSREARWRSILDSISSEVAVKMVEIDEAPSLPIFRAVEQATGIERALAGGSVTTDRGLEGKESGGQAAVAGGCLGSVTRDRGLERNEFKGDALISKDEAAKIEEEELARFRSGWERRNGNCFEDLTLFSPMLFTHCTPGFEPVDAVLARTVQICSIKVAHVEHFKWPLHVYGVVAARDAVDNHRNPIFLRPRDDCQIIYDVDPFLHLTGPVRAIMSEEPLDIEIQLIVKGTTTSEDRALISYSFLYDGDFADGSGIKRIEKNFCTLEICYQQLERSVQATVFGVHVDNKNSLPFEYGVRVCCTSLPECDIEKANKSAPRDVLLLDWKNGRKCAVKNGYLDLSRQVVSVELNGKLKIHMETYTSSGNIAAQGDVFVTPKECNTSEHTCDLGSFRVKFTVAWSFLVEDEELILMNGCIDPLSFCPPVDLSSIE